MCWWGVAKQYALEFLANTVSGDEGGDLEGSAMWDDNDEDEVIIVQNHTSVIEVLYKDLP